MRYYLWPLALIVSTLGFSYPVLGLVVFPAFGAILVLGFLRGRYWCGNVCPRGALYDLLLGKKVGPRKKFPAFFRRTEFRAAVFAAFLTMFTANTWSALQSAGQPGFWDRLGMVGVTLCALTTLIGLFLSLLIHPRSWCTFCPMGSVQKALEMLRVFLSGLSGLSGPLADEGMIRVRITNPNACLKCGVCSKACPMQLRPHLPLSLGARFSDPDCTRCGTCTTRCKRNLLYVGDIRPQEPETSTSGKEAVAARAAT